MYARHAAEVRNAVQHTQTVLAHFDTTSLHLHFNAPPTIDETDRTRKQQTTTNDAARILQQVPAAIVAHEYSHLLQAATTATGARQFALSTELHRYAKALIAAASRLSPGRVPVPLLAEASRFAHDELFSTILEGLTLLVRTAHIDLGGIHVPFNDSDSFPRSLAYEVGHEIFGIPSDGLIVATLGKNGKASRRISLGSMHLQEGFASAIEMIHRKQWGGEGLAAQTGPGVYGTNEAVAGPISRLFEPYFITHELYGRMMRLVGDDCAKGGTLEELCLIIDCALMLDPDVLFSNSRTPPDRYDYMPMDEFLRLLETFGKNYRKIPRVNGDLSPDKSAAFQNALLDARGIPGNMMTLTAGVERFISRYFQFARGNEYLHPGLMDFYEKTYTEMLEWRRKELTGSVALWHLLLPSGDIHKDVATRAPTLSIGIVQMGQRHGEENFTTMMVDAYNRERQLVDALVFSGDATCELHSVNPRLCTVPEYGLCNGVLRVSPADSRCTRETILKHLLRTTGVAEFVS